MLVEQTYFDIYLNGTKIDFFLNRTGLLRKLKVRFKLDRSNSFVYSIKFGTPKIVDHSEGEIEIRRTTEQSSCNNWHGRKGRRR